MYAEIDYVLEMVYCSVYSGILGNMKSGGTIFLYMKWGGNRKVTWFNRKKMRCDSTARPGFKSWFHRLLIERPSTNDINLLSLNLFINEMRKLICIVSYMRITACIRNLANDLPPNWPSDMPYLSEWYHMCVWSSHGCLVCDHKAIWKSFQP